MADFIGFGKAFLPRVLPLVLSLALSGCLESSSDSAASETTMPPAATDPEPELTPTAPENSPPEISGVPAIAGTAGQPYTFTPAAEDADHDFLEFAIANKPDWAVFSPETGTLTGTPNDTDVGESDDIIITVTDGHEARAVGPFRLRIHPRSHTPSTNNAAPTISGSPANMVNAGQLYSFEPVASDTDGDALRFSISNRPAWASFSTTTGRLTGTPTVGNVATYSNILISVSDGHVSTALPMFSVQVRGSANHAPKISGAPSTSVQVAQTYTFQPSASDADGDALTYSIENLPSWATFSAATGRLTGSPTSAQVGSYPNIAIRVSDGRVSATLPTFAIAVQAAPNRAPTITGTPTLNIAIGTAYSFTPVANDPDGNSLGFTIRNRPSWARFDTATGRLSGTPTSANGGTFANIVITVSDGHVNASLPAFNLTVGGVAQNRAPTITGTPITSTTVGAAYVFQPKATDLDGDTLAYSIVSRPSWATFSTSTGKLSGTPVAGTYSNISISVSDGSVSVALPTFSVSVTQAVGGRTTLSWNAPTANTDGSALSNLAGYRITYGTNPTALTQTIDLPNPGVTTYVVEDLTAGTWYFAIQAYTSVGTESAPSNVATKTID